MGTGSGSYLGVDVGGTNVRLMASGPAGKRTDIIRLALPASATELVDAIAHQGTRLLAGGAPARVCIGLPGWTTPEIPRWIPNVRYLDDHPLAAVIGERMGTECVLANDAQCALVAELGEGSLSGVEDALLVAVGTGIGGAVLSGGRLLVGATGTIGSFGWLSSDVTEASPHDGPWELAASGRALAALAAPWGGPDGLFDADHRGDEAAQQVVGEYARRLGTGLAALSSIFDPQIILVAGGVSQRFPLLSQRVLAAYRRSASPAVRSVPLRTARLGSDAGVIGALEVARKQG